MQYRQQKIDEITAQTKKERFNEEVLRQELLRKRLNDPDTKAQFRKAFVFKIGGGDYDYSTLKPFCEEIVLAVDGFAEHLDKVRAKLELALADYDSDKDILVMVGRAIDNFLVGTIVAQKVLQKPKARQSWTIGVYYHDRYKFYEVFLDPTIESHEVYTQ